MKSDHRDRSCSSVSPFDKYFIGNLIIDVPRASLKKYLENTSRKYELAIGSR